MRSLKGRGRLELLILKCRDKRGRVPKAPNADMFVVGASVAISK